MVKITFTAVLLFALQSIAAQQADVKERQDQSPPAVTIAEVEKDEAVAKIEKTKNTENESTKGTNSPDEQKISALYFYQKDFKDA